MLYRFPIIIYKRRIIMGTYGYYEANITFANKALAEIFFLGWDNDFWEVTRESDTEFFLTGDGKMFDFTGDDPEKPSFYQNLCLVSSLSPHPWKFWKYAMVKSYSYEYTQEDLDVDDVIARVLKKLSPATKKIIQEFHNTEDEVCIDLLTEFIDCKEIGIWGFFQNEHIGDYCNPWGYQIELLDGELPTTPDKAAKWDTMAWDHHWDYQALEADYEAYLMELLPQQTSVDAFDGNHHTA